MSKIRKCWLMLAIVLTGSLLSLGCARTTPPPSSPQVSADAAALAQAANIGDGMQVARILERVGPSRWREVIQQASDPFWSNFRLSLHSTLQGDSETLTVYKSYVNGDAAGLPLATVTAIRHDRKQK